MELDVCKNNENKCFLPYLSNNSPPYGYSNKNPLTIDVLTPLSYSRNTMVQYSSYNSTINPNPIVCFYLISIAKFQIKGNSIRGIFINKKSNIWLFREH